MDLDDIKRGLRAEIKKRENEQYLTFQCNVRQMCKDVLAKLEEQEVELAEKDAEIAQLQAMLEERNKQVAELKRSLELASNECCSISERAVKNERMLRRALWIARASEASKEVNYWNCENESSYAIVDFNVHHETIASYKAPHHRPYKWILIWEEVERKCRAKAEEYK